MRMLTRSWQVVKKTHDNSPVKSERAASNKWVPALNDELFSKVQLELKKLFEEKNVCVLRYCSLSYKYKSHSLEKLFLQEFTNST